MDFLTIANKIYTLYSYDIYLTFYDTFKNCIISEFNLIEFCKVFNLDITTVKAV